MEVKEAERIVIAKPIASRPSCSSFRSFSELHASAVNVSPSNSCPETAVTAIKPKTERFKPMMNHAPVGVVSSQAEVSGAAVSRPSHEILKSSSKSTVVYKPLAKLVSKTTVSLLASLGNFNSNHQQAMAQVVACVQPSNQVNHHFRTDLSSNFYQNCTSHSGTDKTTEKNLDEDKKSLPPTSTRSSSDGYNWRKYGQKQVKGSEYPRSYYKCTHPNCQVKKKVERSLDGQIAEIVYKGEHNHSKPQPPKRKTSGEQGQDLVSDGTSQDMNNTPYINHLNERNETSESRMENENGVGSSVHLTYSSKAPLCYDPVAGGAFNAGPTTPENSCGPNGDCQEVSRRVEAEDVEPKSKTRKNENQSKEAGISGEGVQEPRIVVQSSPDSDIMGDCFRWRKYGQKVVKGNPYPRSYYRCTSLKCNVRKHVERASDDPTVFLTTYEGKHNHDMPIKNTSAVASEADQKVGGSSKGK